MSGQRVNGKNRRSRTTVIISHSMTKHIDVQRLERSVRGSKVRFETYSGTNVEAISHHVQPCLKKKPDDLIIHVGTNDLKAKSSSDVANEIINLCTDISETHPSTRINISEIITRTDKIDLVPKIREKWLSQGKQTTLKELPFVEMNKSKQGAAILEKYIPGQRLSSRVVNFTFSSIYIGKQKCSLQRKKNVLPGTPKVVKCSIGQRLETDCGLCSRYPSMKECMPILACKRDIQVHLRRLNLCGQAVASKGDLILLRTGIFGSNGEGLTVCPRHRENLGLSWRPKRGCSHPLHGSSKAKPERRVTKKMSMEINDIWERLVSVGSGHAKYEKKDRLKKNINSVYFGYAHSSPWDWRSSGRDSNYYVPYALESGSIRGKNAFKEEKWEESYSANTMTMDVENYKKSNDDSVISLDSGPEYFLTPQEGHQLVSVNNLIRSVHGRDVSPIRAQLRSTIRDVSQSTARYYKRKSLQTCIATLECIAPSQSNELFEKISSEKFERNTVAPENEVVQSL
ncbi:Hypothetical predicted protein [Paramuricea clavata]|uniref:Uncharacterized protein n=1 Tax=Paramuricea clavata TaxID=317549 RepID=A0A6S7FW97_PARCT|nr:Hypothetical predicted protein [Paramuricea clavata]